MPSPKDRIPYVLPLDPFQLSRATEKAMISHSPSEVQRFMWHLVSNNNISARGVSTVADPIKDLFGVQDGIPWDSPVWKNYMEEAKHQDEHVIRNWNQSMDVILIFVCYWYLLY
jgi:hypothetical protein